MTKPNCSEYGSLLFRLRDNWLTPELSLSGTGCRTGPQRGVGVSAFAAPVNRGCFGYSPTPDGCGFERASAEKVNREGTNLCYSANASTARLQTSGARC